jgi:hypothetical protein
MINAELMANRRSSLGLMCEEHPKKNEGPNSGSDPGNLLFVLPRRSAYLEHIAFGTR